MVDQAYYSAERFLNSILETKTISDPELEEAIREYISVGELEIAFEGAFLWYLEHGITFSNLEKRDILRYAQAIGIDKERSIDENAWEKFQTAFLD